jgi:curli biogenesis system outer membrane secretion channel CsgG
MSIASAADKGKVRIAVMDFQNNSDWYWWGDNLGRAAADELVTQLVKTGKFSVIERDKLQAVLDEQALGSSGAVQPSTAAKIGKILGVQLILTGSITKFSIKTISGGISFVRGSYSNAESAVDVRLIDTSTAEILLADEATGSKKFGGGAIKNVDLQKNYDQGVAQEALRPAIQKIVEKIVANSDKFASLAPAAAGFGKILDVKSPQKVYIDLGESDGIKVGDQFTVERVTETIKDDDGNILDQVKSKVGVIEVVQVLSKSSICKIVSGSAQKGDTFKK